MNRRIRGAAIGFLTAAAALVGADRHVLAEGAEQSCTVRGKATMPSTLSIYDKDQEGKVIARFTGAPTALVASSFPASAARRTAVETGTGSGSFRIKGFVDGRELPIYTANTVPVVANHVWIGTHQLVTIAGSSGGRLKVSRSASKPLKGNFTGTAACNAFTLTPGVAPGWNVPGNARGYVVKQSSIELFDAANGAAIQTLSRSPDGGGILLWSMEQRGGWVSVEYHDDIVIEAWARAADLSGLPPGETMDQQRAPITQRGMPRLAVQESIRTVTTRQEIPIRTEPKDSARVIGRIEPDTETMVMDIVAGWASVLPKSLHVAPAPDEQFWVPSKQL